MKKLIGIIVIVGIVTALVIVRTKRVRQVEGAALPVELPPAVEVALVAQGTVVNRQHVLGTVSGADEVDVAPQVMAQVLEMKVREGAVVQKGDLLAALDPSEFRDALAEAEAGVASAQKAYEAQHAATARDRRLFEVKGVALEEWQRSQAAEAAASAALQVAQTRLELAKTRLGYTQITAPLNSVVARRLADPGDLAVAGKALFKLVRQESVRVRAELPPQDFPGLRVGQPVILSLSGRPLDAAISRVFPAMGDSHLAAFECDITNAPPGLVSGATVGLDVQLSSSEGVVVPADALLEGEKGTWVFAVEDGLIRPFRSRSWPVRSTGRA